jgi:hypothetical protein
VKEPQKWSPTSNRTIGGKKQAFEGDVGAVIMLGTLFGLIVLIFGLVFRYDPEARGPSKREDSDG